MNKKLILDLVIEEMGTELETALNGFRSAQRDVHEAEGRMKTRYDSMRTEAAFLADGQAKRIGELEEGLASVRRINASLGLDVAKVGAVVIVADEDNHYTNYFLLPAGGGKKVLDCSEEYVVITPQSPLGKAILNKSSGDEFIFREKEFHIESIY